MIRNLNIKHSIPTIKATFILVCLSISRKMIFMSGQGILADWLLKGLVSFDRFEGQTYLCSIRYI